MKIVILDGYTVNPGDLSWEPIEALGDCRVFERTKADQVFERSRDADVIVTSRKAQACEEVAGEIEALGRQAMAYGAHVGHWDEIDALVWVNVALQAK